VTAASSTGFKFTYVPPTQQRLAEIYGQSNLEADVLKMTPASRMCATVQGLRYAQEQRGIAPPPFSLEDGKGGLQPSSTRFRSTNANKKITQDEDHPSVVHVPWDLFIVMVQSYRPKKCTCQAPEQSSQRMACCI
jgi:hypothetical protein